MDFIDATLKSKFNLQFAREKHIDPCKRIFNEKVFGKALKEVAEVVKGPLEPYWKDEFWGSPKDVSQGVVVDYFGFAKEYDPEYVDVPEAVDLKRASKTFIKKIFSKKKEVKEKGHLLALPRLCRDRFDGMPEGCTNIVIGSWCTEVLGDDMPYTPGKSHPGWQEKRSKLAAYLRDLELGLLTAKTIHKAGTSQMIAILFCCPDPESSDPTMQLLTNEYAADLLAWLKHEEQKAKEIYPLLHELAKQDKFVVLIASHGTDIKCDKIEEIDVKEGVDASSSKENLLASSQA